MRCQRHMICVATYNNIYIYNIYIYVYVCFFCIVKSILNMTSLCVLGIQMLCSLQLFVNVNGI